MEGMKETLLREYVVYKILYSLTDFSMRVRLAEVEYINTNENATRQRRKNSKSMTDYAFFIEPIELFEKRKNVYRVDLENYGQKHIEPEIIDKIAIFNYMIGNTDWAVPLQHNIQLYTNPLEDTRKYLTAVAYDFDYNGIVNSSYAIPVEELNISSFRNRVFQGLCRTDDEWLKTLEIFRDKEDEFREIIISSPLLNRDSKKYMLSFLDDFYVMLKNPGGILKDFRSTCKEY
jgi:hypothetical protein